MKTAKLTFLGVASAALFALQSPLLAQSQQQGGMQQGQQGQQQGDQVLQQERASASGTELYLSPATVRSVKQQLNQQGYDVGAVDGQWSSEAQQALKNFQQARQLEPTGNINMRTLASLGLGEVIAGADPAGLPGQRLAQETAQGSGTPLYASPSMVRLVEQALNNSGYDAGSVDGMWDRTSSTAAMNFQQAQGLEPTGNLNFRTIKALGLSEKIQQLAQNQDTVRDQKLSQEVARSSGTPIYLSPSAVSQVQQALNQSGYDSGNVSGEWASSSSKAARNFQQAKGLEPTGRINESMIEALGLRNVLALEDIAGGGAAGSSARGRMGAAQSGQPGQQSQQTGRVEQQRQEQERGGAQGRSQGSQSQVDQRSSGQDTGFDWSEP